MTRRVNLSRVGKGAWPSLITVTKVPLSKASNPPSCSRLGVAFMCERLQAHKCYQSFPEQGRRLHTETSHNN